MFPPPRAVPSWISDAGPSLIIVCKISVLSSPSFTLNNNWPLLSVPVPLWLPSIYAKSDTVVPLWMPLKTTLDARELAPLEFATVFINLSLLSLLSPEAPGLKINLSVKLAFALTPSWWINLIPISAVDESTSLILDNIVP